jgi:hypothetical protein
MKPQRVHTIRGPNVGTDGNASGPTNLVPAICSAGQ